MADQEDPLKAAEIAARQLALTCKGTFSTPEGERMLAELRAEFDPTQIVVPNDPYMTHYRLGGQDVLRFIDALIKLAENGNETK
jgi:hypothetical protein